jgi:cation diffusion facilitator CzcD-associated flavoprotein CzcO
VEPERSRTVEQEPAEWVDVVVVGAGVSGIGMAWHLHDALPELSFTLLEARDAIGGTWDLFRYPGVRSDSDVQTYSYAFRPWTAPDMLASGDAILRYLDDTLDEHGLRAHVRLRHRVLGVEWSSARSCWTVDAERTDTGEPVCLRCSWLIATTGYFRYDRGCTPEFAGLDRYRGTFLHAQECPADLDVDGKRVAVIGSGATAATLIPALADRGAHVTMVQRSPSYYASLPRHDPIADALRRHLAPARAQRWTRSKNQATLALFYRLCRWQPDRMKRLLVGDVRRRLPEGFDVERHFTPSYGPWDQRVCIVPGGDLFEAIRAGDVDVVTGVIDTFTEGGLRLCAGDEVDADVVIAATGLEVLALGDVDVVVDGEAMPAAARLVYKSVMLSDVPNFGYVFGYTNASWTLKVDLAAAWLCRVIAHMRATGATKVVPPSPVGEMPTRSMLDLQAGYLLRAEDRLPRQGTGVWSVPKSYRADARRLLRDPVDDGTLKFSHTRVLDDRARSQRGGFLSPASSSSSSVRSPGGSSRRPPSNRSRRANWKRARFLHGRLEKAMSGLGAGSRSVDRWR